MNKQYSYLRKDVDKDHGIIPEGLHWTHFHNILKKTTEYDRVRGLKNKVYFSILMKIDNCHTPSKILKL